jgi:hypothetical protein
VAVYPSELRVEERAFEVDAQAPRAGGFGRFDERVRGFGNLARGVQHRLPRCRHDGRDESRRALRGVRVRGDLDGVALIAIEQRVFGAVGMDVDHAGSDGRAGRESEVRGPAAFEHRSDTTVLDGEAAVARGAVTECEPRRPERVGA